MTVTVKPREVQTGVGLAPDAQRARHRLPPSRHPPSTGCVLTPRELTTVRQMARGLTYAEAASETHCTLSTIRALLHNAYGRLGVRTKAEALILCTRVGWLDEVSGDGVGVEHVDRRVSWAQRLYLEAFEQSLRPGDDPTELARTRVLREATLTGMYNESGRRRPPRRTTGTDAIERIYDAMRGLDAGPPRGDRDTLTPGARSS